MKKEEIIKICESNKELFKENITDIRFESKGIFNSEMLLFISLVKHLAIEEIWESGRARGQSTKVIAECFKNANIKISSVELLKDTADDKIALKRLKNYDNLRLMYGNSKEILLTDIAKNKKTVVLFDGPKGSAPINLAIKLFENKNIKAIFMHDYHLDSPLRKVIEERFNKTFFTDDKEYVEKFRDLDDACWIVHSKVGSYPYRRGAREMKSYSYTLCVIFNEL